MQSLRRKLPPPNALVAFECAARHGNFTRAAAELGLTQPSVTRHIQLLEEFVGRALFTRNHNRLTLTAEGVELFDAVSLGLSHIAGAVERITARRTKPRLTIACSFGMSHFWLMPRFSRLRSLLPDYDLRLITSEDYRDYDAADVDLSIRFGDADWGEMAAIPLFDEKVFPVCTPELLSRFPDLEEDFRVKRRPSAPLLKAAEDGKGWLDWPQWLAAAGMPEPDDSPAYEYDLYPFLLQAALEHQGVALAWHQFVRAPLDSGALIQIGDAHHRPERGYFFVFRPQQLPDEVDAAISEFVRVETEAWPPAGLLASS